MKRSFYALPLLVVFALLVAACGGGGSSGKLASTDAAVVGGQHITKSSFDEVMTQQTLGMKAQGQKVPKPGSSDYTSLRSQVMSALVQNAELESEASKLGVSVTSGEVKTQLEALKQQYFGGDEKTYEKQIKAQGYTDADVRSQVRLQLLEQKLYDKVTADVSASDKQVAAYFQSHKAQYPATRAVQEILVGKGKKTLADSIHDQLAKGGSWAKLAKKYSQDPGSKDSAGKFTAQKGKDVPEFDKAVFAQGSKAGTLLAPVETQAYGWFVIKLDGPVKPATEQANAPAIRATLEQQQRQQQMSDWVKKVAEGFCSGKKITYQAGYQPNPDPCASLAEATNTTTTTSG